MSYKLFSFIIILFLFSNRLSGQNLLKKQLLLSEDQSGSILQPKESLKIALLLLKGTNTNEEKVKLNLLVYKIYNTFGDYTNASNYLFEASSKTETNSVFQNAKINIAKTALLRKLFLYKQSNIYFDKVRKDLNKLKQNKELIQIKSLIQFEELELLLQKEEYNEANELIQKSNYRKALQNENIKRFLLIQSKIDLKLGNFSKSISNLEYLKKTVNKEDQYFEFQVLDELAKNYFYQQKFSKVIEYSLKAKKILHKLDNLYFLESTTQTLVLSYLALNNEQEYKLLNTKLLTIKSEIDKKEKETINTVYNLVNVEYQANFLKDKAKYTYKLNRTIVIFIIVLIVLGLLWYRKYSHQKRLTEIVSYLEITTKNLTEKTEKHKLISKKNSISAETEQIILNKLKKFESSIKFTNKEISLSVLAGQFDTNTKYLSEIINTHYNVNFSAYINTLRINFIIDKLTHDHNFCNYKISYLAELSGFSSHSSFATVFKSICGISPITFIDLLKKEKNDTNISLSENE